MVSRAGGARAAARLRGLPPVLAADTRVLILGSFPGAASLAASSTTRIRAITSGPSSARCSASRWQRCRMPQRLARVRAHGGDVGYDRRLRAGRAASMPRSAMPSAARSHGCGALPAG